MVLVLWMTIDSVPVSSLLSGRPSTGAVWIFIGVGSKWVGNGTRNYGLRGGDYNMH